MRECKIPTGGQVRMVSVKDMEVWSRIFWRRASKTTHDAGSKERPELFSRLTIWKTFWQRLCQSGEYAGILQVVVDADAPWQNGKCERHG